MVTGVRGALAVAHVAQIMELNQDRVVIQVPHVVATIALALQLNRVRRVLVHHQHHPLQGKLTVVRPITVFVMLIIFVIAAKQCKLRAQFSLTMHKHRALSLDVL